MSEFGGGGESSANDVSKPSLTVLHDIQYSLFLDCSAPRTSGRRGREGHRSSPAPLLDTR